MCLSLLACCKEDRTHRRHKKERRHIRGFLSPMHSTTAAAAASVAADSKLQHDGRRLVVFSPYRSNRDSSNISECSSSSSSSLSSSVKGLKSSRFGLHACMRCIWRGRRRESSCPPGQELHSEILKQHEVYRQSPYTIMKQKQCERPQRRDSTGQQHLYDR